MLVVGKGSGKNYDNNACGGGSGLIIYLANIPLSTWTNIHSIEFNNNQVQQGNTYCEFNSRNKFYANDAPLNSPDGALTSGMAVSYDLISYVKNCFSNGGNNYGWYPNGNSEYYCGGGAGTSGNGKVYGTLDQANGGDGCGGYMAYPYDEIHSGVGYRANTTIVPISSIFEGTGVGAQGWGMNTNPPLYYGGGAGGYGDAIYAYYNYENNRSGYGAGGGVSGNNYKGQGGPGIVVLYYHNNEI